MPAYVPFEIRCCQSEHARVVDVVGEIDLATAPKLADAIGATSEIVRRVVVDLTEVTFVDSSALNVLIDSRRTLAGQGIHLHLVSPIDHPVRRLFEIAPVTEPFRMAESRAEALG